LKTRKRHDTGYPPTFTLRDSAGPVNLTAATGAFFIMVNAQTGAIKVNAACVIDPDQVNNTGQVTYNFQAIDVDTTGTYKCEVRVNWNTGTQSTFPSDSYETLQIIDDLDNA
jgi:hypothetical protein